MGESFGWTTNYLCLQETFFGAERIIRAIKLLESQTRNRLFWSYLSAFRHSNGTVLIYFPPYLIINNANVDS